MDPIEKGYKDAMNNTVEQDFDRKPEPYPTLYTKGYNVGLKEIKRIEEWAKKHQVEAAYPLGIIKDFLVRSNPLFEGGALKELQAYIRQKYRQEKEKRRYRSSKGSYKDPEVDPRDRSITIIDPRHEQAARILTKMHQDDLLEVSDEAVEELAKLAAGSLVELSGVPVNPDELDVAYTMKTLGKRKRTEFRKTRKSKSVRKTRKSKSARKTRKSKSVRKMK